ncbi:MAG: FAD-dependent oxidoreductase [Oscillospiraceae bacterium]|nr:FAD-dependent oxidoreductase [Oscillospiraceae bacterium]
MLPMFNTVYHEADFCVVGGGLSGMCAAIAAAREGTKTVLMHERPVLGGNASSEIRMWICGAGGSNNRETGILEEIQLESLYRNPYKIYAIWDSILYEKVKFEPNIELLLNCSCCDAEMDGNKIISVTGWQMTTQCWHVVKAKNFADCSGDSVLAPLTGAEYRIGRESKFEFGEEISVEEADNKTMGMSCLIQARKLDTPVTFIAPEWATKLKTEDLKYRRPNLEGSGENFWYLELGGNQNSIDDSEKIRDELVALAYGMWDYIKNSGEFEADLWQLDFLGFLPGKRESRRMMGKYLMTQLDISAGGMFEDVVAFGGWPLDDHDPDGFWHSGRPNINGKTPSPYGIPYRTLYSNNIENLFFAGRNISLTHAAMSSARIMATCALLGQAVGTAAALSVKYDTTPDGVYTDHINELKETLMFNDCFLPYNKRTVSELTVNANLSSNTSPANAAGNIENLRNGIDRNNHTYGDAEQGFMCDLGGFIDYRFNSTMMVNKVRIIFDSDLDRNTLPGDGVERTHTMRASVKNDSPVMCVPKTLVKEYLIELADENGNMYRFYKETENRKRFVTIDIQKEVSAVRLVPISTWGEDRANIISFDLY